jgi:hypothetical protein
MNKGGSNIPAFVLLGEYMYNKNIRMDLILDGGAA